MKTLLAIILISAPFALVFLFQNQRRGLAYICAGMLALELLIIVALQSLGYFSYIALLVWHLLLSITATAVIIRHRLGMSSLQFDWWWLVTVITGGFCLWQIHYSFTGIASTSTTIKEVVNASYPLPIYSDEWLAAAMVRRVIQNGTLPLINPLLPATFFPNLLFPFHSLLSGFFLFTALNPIKHFAVAGIVVSLFVLSCLYITIRTLNVRPQIAAVFTVASLLITQGGNLPGLWFLLPFLPATGILLLFLNALLWNDKRLAICCGLLSVTLYPPLLIFVVAATIGMFIERYRPIKAGLYSGLTLAGIVLFTALSLWLTDIAGLTEIQQAIRHGLSHANLSGGTPEYLPWYILPVGLLVFILLGLWQIIKNRQLIIGLPIVIGLTLWLFYLQQSHVYVIEAPRVVMITSLLLIIPAAISAELVLAFAVRRHEKVPRLVPLIILVSMIYLGASYPLDDNWRLLRMKSVINGETYIFQPSPAINYHLHPDDARIFASHTGQRFIAPEWKGLVIGAVSDNYPLQSKGSTITNHILRYQDFFAADCTQKTKMAQQFQIDLVYSASFTCPGFAIIDQSEQGFILYEVQ